MYPTNRPDDQGAPRTYPERQRPLTGRHRRPADGRPGSEGSPGRRLDRIAAAEQSLRDAQRALVGSGSDPDVVGLAFAIARDCLAEAKDCSELARRELALARVERAEAQQRLDSAPSPARPAEPVTADAGGVNLCPDPTGVKTPAEFVDFLRRYHIWAGKPSYRVMERQCNRRFAASTLHSALHGSRLPSLDMVLAIITACRGTQEHQRAFASAWRVLEMNGHDARQRPAASKTRSRALYPVGESA